ncbi:hypothetical protein DPMN_113200 [Dreissena polymorpha]|uniref:Uncharacterized protein n=1 Tax=Dreissena polymorpha TaxID=45954 RepID=A0A9D4KHV3_DREPO|nr:hypothetical protein DPMN_113200 [Dreissena polymorpha]
MVNLTPSNLYYTLTEGQTLRNISCYADCYPKCTYNCRKTSASTLVSDTDVVSFGSIRRGDAGIYECTAKIPDYPTLLTV